MLNQIQNTFAEIKKYYSDNPQRALTQTLKFSIILGLTASFYPIIHFGIASLIYAVSAVVTPLFSIALSVVPAVVVVELATPKIEELVRYVRENTPSKNDYEDYYNSAPGIDTVKHYAASAYNAMPTLPSLSSVKAMLFSQPAARTTSTEETNANTLTGLTPKHKNT